MAEEPIKPSTAGAIPPKAVPPQFRAVADAAPVEASTQAAPRTVRLKPVTVGAGGSALPGAAKSPIASPGATAASGGVDAAEAIKRMTARIAMLSGEVEPGTKKRTGQIPVGGVDPSVKKATSGLSGVLTDPNPTVKRMTTRIQMPSQTGLIPDISTAGPKTIKVKPLNMQGSTQPIRPGEAGTDGTGVPNSTVKIGTSRIPLESAMEVPPQEPVAAEGAPKTIKLKRPGEMSTVKVSVMGQKPAVESVPAAAPTIATPATPDAAGSKKTIRVKRPNAPAAAGLATGEAEGAHGAPGVTALPLPAGFSAVAPERGTGWFIAVAAACIILVIGLGCLYAVQLYGGRPHTELDQSFQHNYWW